jgi:O-acetyl-ADP-ribose deacetylase (regulator of RNase III)
MLVKQNEESEMFMSKMVLINTSCADQAVDAVVNAANDGLWEGGGICGAIFKKAGSAALTAACKQYKTPLKDGSAVITPAFKMTNAKAIIHAVGPDFGQTPQAFKELFDAYYNSLKVLMDNGLYSISFPLISAGIFGGRLADPVGESTKQCCRAYLKFTADYPDYPIDVKLCAYTLKELKAAQAVFSAMTTE